MITLTQQTVYLPRDEILVAANGGRNEDVVSGTNANQVIEVHHNSVLCNSLCGCFHIQGTRTHANYVARMGG